MEIYIGLGRKWLRHREVTKRTHKHTSAHTKETTATSKSKTRVKGMKYNNELPKTLPAPEIIPDSS